MTPRPVTQVAQVTFSDIGGGAARASHRIHHALRAAGVESTLWVRRRESDEPHVKGPAAPAQRLLNEARVYSGHAVTRILGGRRPVLHSLGLWPSRWPRQLAQAGVDLVHLHWVGGETLSVGDIGRLRGPVVWTLHDMWAFCGAEHYSDDLRWAQGYGAANRPRGEPGLDLNRWTWQRKRRCWQRPMHLVAPSRWMADCVRRSALMAQWPVSVVPNPIDTDRWRPEDPVLARRLLGLPAEGRLLLFGAIGGTADARKGFDLLAAALSALAARQALPDLQLVVFGQSAPAQPPALGFPVHFTGALHDDLSLRLAYAAADAFVLPSRQDNLPNTGVEALACGTPVIAFDTGGLPDIVVHRETGYLARAFEPLDLAQGIVTALDPARQPALRAQARARAVAEFDAGVVARRYLAIYREAAVAAATSQVNPARP